MVPPTAAHTVREHLAKPFDRLALPCAHLVRMNLVLRGNLLQRPWRVRDVRLALEQGDGEMGVGFVDESLACPA